MSLSAPLQFSLRALRAESRERGAMHARWILPALLVAVQAFFILGGASSTATAPGLDLLSVVVNTAVIFQFFSMSYYASGFTEEREAGVIELLLLSGGGRGSIALGILADRLVRPLVSLVVLLPLLALCVAMGGVDTQAVLHGALQIFLATLLCHAVGALISALMPSTFAAACASYLFWLAFLAAPYLLDLVGVILSMHFDWPQAEEVLMDLRIQAGNAWDSFFFPAWMLMGLDHHYWPAKALICLLAWALAVRVFVRWPAGPGLFTRSTRKRTRISRARPPAERAIFWKQGHFCFPGRWFGWKYDAFWLLALVSLLVFPFPRVDRMAWASVIAFAACVAAVLRSTLHAWTLVWPEFKAGTWDGLVGTPAGLQGVLRQKILSLVRPLPFELAAAVVAFSMFVGVEGQDWDNREFLWFAGIGLGGSLLLVTATFYFSLVVPLLAPGLACGAILGVILVCALTESPHPFLFFAPTTAFVFASAARDRLARELPEEDLFLPRKSAPPPRRG